MSVFDLTTNILGYLFANKEQVYFLIIMKGCDIDIPQSIPSLRIVLPLKQGLRHLWGLI